MDVRGLQTEICHIFSTSISLTTIKQFYLKSAAQVVQLKIHVSNAGNVS